MELFIKHFNAKVLKKVPFVTPMGLEPMPHGLKVRYSTN